MKAPITISDQRQEQTQYGRHPSGPHGHLHTRAPHVRSDPSAGHCPPSLFHVYGQSECVLTRTLACLTQAPWRAWHCCPMYACARPSPATRSGVMGGGSRRAVATPVTRRACAQSDVGAGSRAGHARARRMARMAHARAWEGASAFRQISVSSVWTAAPCALRHASRG